MCFLLSLVDHEEIGELEISDLVNTNTSVFATLLANDENMKVWCSIIIIWKYVYINQELKQVIKVKS